MEGNAIEAALEVAARVAEQQRERHQALALELEASAILWKPRLAVRLYDAVDPDNRLVASELEARWNAALSAVGEVEQQLRDNELPANANDPSYRPLYGCMIPDAPAQPWQAGLITPAGGNMSVLNIRLASTMLTFAILLDTNAGSSMAAASRVSQPNPSRGCGRR